MRKFRVRRLGDFHHRLVSTGDGGRAMVVVTSGEAIAQTISTEAEK
jgi:hypothetical protein